jgi:hypothetical protein
MMASSSMSSKMPRLRRPEHVEAVLTVQVVVDVPVI